VAPAAVPMKSRLFMIVSFVSKRNITVSWMDVKE
jgi:hypothetical protein